MREKDKREERAY